MTTTREKCSFIVRIDVHRGRTMCELAQSQAVEFDGGAPRSSAPGDVWRALDDHYQSVIPGYVDFCEADGHFSEVLNGSIGWFHLYGTSQNDLPNFHTRYEAAVAQCNSLPNPSNVRTKARDLLQGFYTSLPFETMKRVEYDYHVRPPQ